LVVLIKDTNKSLFYITAYHQDTIGVLKAKIQVKTNIAVDKQRLIYAGRTQNDDNTLSVFNIREGDILHLALELVGGMPKKGTKKVVISKYEKVHGLRARATFQAMSVAANPYVTAVLANVSQPNYIFNAMQQTNLVEIRAISHAAENVTREDRLHSVLQDLMIPELKTLKDQKADIDQQIKAIEQAFELGFNDRFYTNTGLVTDPLYDAIDTHTQALEMQQLQQQQALQQQLADAQAQLAQAVGAPAADAVL